MGETRWRTLAPGRPYSHDQPTGGLRLASEASTLYGQVYPGAPEGTRSIGSRATMLMP